MTSRVADGCASAHFQRGTQQPETPRSLPPANQLAPSGRRRSPFMRVHPPPRGQRLLRESQNTWQGRGEMLGEDRGAGPFRDLSVKPIRFRDNRGLLGDTPPPKIHGNYTSLWGLTIHLYGHNPNYENLNPNPAPTSSHK